MRELALAREVERHGLLPLLLAGVALEGAAAAGVVDQDADGAELVRRRLGDARRRALLQEVLDDQHRLDAAGGHDLGRHLLEQVGAPRHQRQAHALAAERQRDAAADAHAGARHQRRLAFDLQVHVCLSMYLIALTVHGVTRNRQSHFGSLLARMRYLNFICSATRSDPSNALNGFKPNCLCDSSTAPDASN